MSISEPLNLYELLVVTISGSMEVFVFLSLIIISAMSAKFQMPKSVFLVMIALFGIILSNWIGGIYLIIILLAGIAIFGGFSRLFN